MLLPLNRKSGLAAGLAFFVLLVWIWHEHLLPDVIGGKLPVFDNPFSDILGHGDNNTAVNHALNGTHPRYWTIDEDILSGTKRIKRPENVKKIMGLVFFGRRETVSILDCYLKRNLVKNGGMLDGVIWLERTSVKKDLALLDKLVENEPAYERWVVDMSGDGFTTSYDKVEDDVLYIKMDDDIVFIEDTTIPSLIYTRLTHPEFFIVSANVVNQPLISWIHWHLGAVKPYLPELDEQYPEPKHGESVDWHASSLPAWKGPEDFDPMDWKSPGNQKHRWLPLRGKTDHVLEKTPIAETEYDAFGKGWTKWPIGAQEHYSFLENLEKNELWRYKFNTWDFQLKRMGIQFVAIMGKDINVAKPIAADDEHHLAVATPEKLGRHAVADGRGVVAHYSFGSQIGGKGGMKTTDILDRYRAFAAENICKDPMLWNPEDEKAAPGEEKQEEQAEKEEHTSKEQR